LPQHFTIKSCLDEAKVWNTATGECGVANSMGSQPPVHTQHTKVGQDKDAHACIHSAGYVWSSLAQQCIRPFEQGVAFTRSDHHLAEPQTAYAYLSEDLLQAEVFFATTDKPIILQAVAVVEGDTAPILYKNDIEQIDIISVKDTFYLRYQHQAIYSAHSFGRYGT
ncbi:MAG: hypothetical protein ACRCWP_04905, partial [Shewanella sp.]